MGEAEVDPLDSVVRSKFPNGLPTKDRLKRMSAEELSSVSTMQDEIIRQFQDFMQTKIALLGERSKNLQSEIISIEQEEAEERLPPLEEVEMEAPKKAHRSQLCKPHFVLLFIALFVVLAFLAIQGLLSFDIN